MSTPTMGSMEELDSKQAAQFLGYTLNTLNSWRIKNQGPPYVKKGQTAKSRVRYLMSDLIAWKGKYVRVVPGPTSGMGDAA